ncbi:Probable cation-transporting ATPase F [uncultured Ruminococcus sp.]|nr:Probable cation-transporting ATPase F [uncultured Clostridium sp.]SCI06074.1 Probable cation-transporting ATPase F [uncultured Ruminococcus sp.]
MEWNGQGLTEQEVAQRVAAGQINVNVDVKTKSIKRILVENIFSLFNLINFMLAAVLLVVGSYKNMLFMGVIICNTLIGIIQEIRSKRAVDRLSIVVLERTEVLRGREFVELPIEDIVLDDIIRLGRGAQIPSDAEVVSGECMVNESLLTGESDLIRKRVGDTLMSGSFITGGECIARVIHVGKDNYASQINSSAKYIKQVKSEMMTTFNRIIQFVSIIIFPLGAILFWNQYTAEGATASSAIVNTVAALIGMIPEGLILLTSTVLAVSVIRLSQNKVLVQHLYCIETLARVDVLCLDKTGTITCDEMEVERVIPLPGQDEGSVSRILASIAKGSHDENSTVKALQKYYQKEDSLPVARFVDFSSEKKWSGAVLGNGESYVMGAGEFILKDRFSLVRDTIEQVAGCFRVLTVAHVPGGFTEDGDMAGAAEPVALVLIQDKIREEASDTIRYFTEQGVRLKVISGDGVTTVSNIARQAGIPDAQEAVDATLLKTDEALKEAAERCHVFGRVTPQQKQKLIRAMKEHGHTVAMTGDGVNDVLALKEADCSVAMAAGSDAARNVAQLVLIENDFSAMPKVVAEGRRTINNIQRSSSLFLVKTLFSILLGLLTVVIHMRYPFQPIQMSLVGAFTIGIPSFILALEPNHDRVTGKFFWNIISRAIPGALTIVINIGLVYLFQGWFDLTHEQVSTVAVVLTALTGILLLLRISVPFTPIRTALFLFVITGMGIGLTVFRSLFEIAPFTAEMGWVIGILSVVCVLLFSLFYGLMNRFFIKSRKPEISKKGRA